MWIGLFVADRRDKHNMTRTPYRYSSTFNRTYPWRNGLILHHGPLLAWIQNQRPANCPQDVLELIEVQHSCYTSRIIEMRYIRTQDIAGEIDEFDTSQVCAHTSHIVLSNWMSGTIDPNTEQTTKASTFIGQSYLAYQLLDMLVWCHGWPEHPSNRLVPPASPPVLVPPQYAMVIDELSKPKLLPTDQITLPTTSSVQAPELSDHGAPLTVKAIKHFSLAYLYAGTMDSNDVRSVLHAVAFILAGFRPVSISYGYIVQLTCLP
jgi:hypothetical protein